MDDPGQTGGPRVGGDAVANGITRRELLVGSAVAGVAATAAGSLMGCAERLRSRRRKRDGKRCAGGPAARRSSAP